MLFNYRLFHLVVAHSLNCLKWLDGRYFHAYIFIVNRIDERRAIHKVNIEVVHLVNGIKLYNFQSHRNAGDREKKAANDCEI